MSRTFVYSTIIVVLIALLAPELTARGGGGRRRRPQRRAFARLGALFQSPTPGPRTRGSSAYRSSPYRPGARGPRGRQ